MSIDLENISNMYLLTYTSETFDNMKVWYEKERNGIRLKIYKYGKKMIVCFSPFNCEKIIHHLYNGAMILWKQDTINIDIGNVNRFFYDISLELSKEIMSKIRDFFFSGKKKLIITGMSLGGALGQCFYIHFRNLIGDYQTTIHSFGSPRIGDIKLAKWFISQNKLEITNYGLFELDSDNIKRIDPVCLFPSRKYGNYVNNVNLKMIFRKQIVDHAEYNIDQPDTEITPLSIICNLGLDKKTSELWDKIHDTDLYFSNIG
jgi:hypothetical protein